MFSGPVRYRALVSSLHLLANLEPDLVADDVVPAIVYSHRDQLVGTVHRRHSPNHDLTRMPWPRLELCADKVGRPFSIDLLYPQRVALLRTSPIGSKPERHDHLSPRRDNLIHTAAAGTRLCARAAHRWTLARAERHGRIRRAGALRRDALSAVVRVDVGHAGLELVRLRVLYACDLAGRPCGQETGS